jgi:hypothetical protein
MNRRSISTRVDDRAVSTTVNYILGLSIMFLLATGLFIAGGDFVNDQRDQAIRSELQVVGQQIANDVARIDRTAEGAGYPRSSTSVISTSQRVPNKVAGYTYNIAVREPSPDEPQLFLSTQNPDIRVRVDLVARTEVILKSNLDGGTYRVVYRPRPSMGDPALEVTDDA